MEDNNYSNEDLIKLWVQCRFTVLQLYEILEKTKLDLYNIGDDIHKKMSFKDLLFHFIIII